MTKYRDDIYIDLPDGTKLRVDSYGEPVYETTETFTICKCKKCGFQEPVPDFALAESVDIQKFMKKKECIPKLDCPKCNKTMIPVKYFK